MHTVDFHHWVTVSNAQFDLVCSQGLMNAPSVAGLGVVVRASTFGAPLFTFH